MEQEHVTAIDSCRVCGGTAFAACLDLGPQRLSGFPADGAILPVAPLTLLRCTACGLVQLQHQVRSALLFQDEYWYASGINGAMREELRNVVRAARGWTRVQDGDWVLDIGANDGTLLNAWREHAWEGRPNRVGVEPSPSFRAALAECCDIPLEQLYPGPAALPWQFKVITSIAMFYAVNEPVDFARAVAANLTDDGVWIVQMQDLRSMVRATAFDNICHEHVAYYDVRTFWEVCRRAGLRIVNYTPREINGGSLRFVCMKADPGAPNPCPVVPAHDQLPIDWPGFAERMDRRLAQLQDVVTAAHSYGQIVDLLGASTKGNTLLQLAGLGPAQVRQCWERHPTKIGRTTITGIPIVHEDQGRRAPPDLLICPIWQFRGGLIEREHAYLSWGGRIYFPLPDGELYFSA